MRAAETVAGLAAFPRRGAGTDAERRSALWLASELAGPRRSASLETFWCRPNWALAHAWHVALALAGSLVSISSPRVGGALVLAALLFVIADERLGLSPGRRLTPEHASQNVVAAPIESEGKVRLILTANYDAGRSGLCYRDRLRNPLARLNAALGRRPPGWLGWLAIALVWLLVISLLRLKGQHGTAIGVLQLFPTIGLVLALALLLDQGSADYGPAASDNGSGVGVVLALAQALDAAPPRRLGVEVVLQGAGDGFGIGLRRYLRQRRRTLRPADTIVLGFAPCGSGAPRWWMSDGQFVPMRYLAQLQQLAAQTATQTPDFGARPHRGRAATPALPGRSGRLPAIAVGCLDDRGRTPHSHQATDTAQTVDPAALDTAVQFGLLLVDAIDGFLRTRPSDRGHGISLRRPLAILARRERKASDQLRT